jgi:hypothetical protein
MALPQSINKFIGTWFGSDQTAVEYSVFVRNDKIVITGKDTNDGEKLHIKDVSFNGSELRFSSICPSTRYALSHVFRSLRGNNVKHEFTRVENWKRKKIKPTSD